MISSSYPSGGDGLQGGDEKTRACFSAEVLRSTGYRSDQSPPFQRILHAARQMMFSAKMTAPVVSTQPTHQPICGSTRACHPVFLPSGSIAPGLDDHDILDQTLMLDLERKLVSIQFSQEIHLFHG